jgi:two-component system chemotaxis response regulator CheY
MTLNTVLEVADMAKILVVDDSEFMRKVLRNILEAGGHKVIEARNADDAVERFAKEGADVITMDIVMPKQDGIEAVKRLKEANEKAKIIMISALGHQKTVMRSLEAGAVDFIIKPFTADDVLESVNAVLQMEI